MLPHGLTAVGAGSTTLLLRGILVKPGGGLAAVVPGPRPGGGEGRVEALVGNELLKPDRENQWKL